MKHYYLAAIFMIFFIGLCTGIAIMAITEPQHYYHNHERKVTRT